MSTRRVATSDGEVSFDHGAQYFTVRDTAFHRQVSLWMDAGIAAPWPSAGSEAYVGVPTMSAPVKSMAALQSVQWSTLVANIEPLDRGWRFVLEPGETVDVDIAVVATPAEQTAALLNSVAPRFAASAQSAPCAPCWTLMLAFNDAVDVVQDCWRGTEAIGWAARNSSKPGRATPESWVVQAGPEWSRTHLEADPDWIAKTLTQDLQTLLGVALPPVVGQSVHRWRYARSGADGSGAIFDQDLGLGICGDWLIGPRVEAAWLSGTSLAKLI